MFNSAQGRGGYDAGCGLRCAIGSVASAPRARRPHAPPRAGRRAIGDHQQASLDLQPALDRLSGGERQMVAMSMALLRKPNTIMFDEPTANLSPMLATEVLNTITFLAKDSDITILLVEQNATRALQIGHSAYLLVNGTTIFEGSAKSLL